MAIDLTSPTSSPIPVASFNPIVPSGPLDAAIIREVVTVNKPVDDWYHAGTIDYTEAGLDGYDGCGLNAYGLYGILDGTPKFLLAARGFDHPDTWGLVAGGEFRVGEDVTATGIADNTKVSMVFNPVDATLILNNSSIICRDSTKFVAINQNGIAGGDSTGSFTMFVSNTTDHASLGFDSLEVGEVRIGSNVITTGNTLLRYLPSVGLTVKGTIQATDGYIIGDLTIGTSNNITIYGDTSTPYIQSSSYTGGDTGTGWKINYDGVAYFNEIIGVSNWIKMYDSTVQIWSDYSTSSGVINLNSSGGHLGFGDGSIGGSGWTDVFSANNDGSVGIQVTNGEDMLLFGAGDIKIYNSSTSYDIYLGNSVSGDVNILPASTKRLNLGYGNQIQIDNNEIGFFERAPISRRTVTVNYNDWVATSTAVADLRDCVDYLYSIQGDMLKALGYHSTQSGYDGLNLFATTFAA